VKHKKWKATKAAANATTVTDPVYALAVYWKSADYMRALAHRIRDQYAADRRKHMFEFRTYTSYWLSGLYVVAEGFDELGLDTTKVPEITNDHLKKLKRFRNGCLGNLARRLQHAVHRMRLAIVVSQAPTMIALRRGTKFGSSLRGIIGNGRDQGPSKSGSGVDGRQCQVRRPQSA
jgi:hypothetical protein